MEALTDFTIPDWMPEWLVIPTILLAAFSWAIGTKGFKEFKSWVIAGIDLMRDQSLKRAKEKSKADREAYILLDDFLREAGASRAVLISIHNGGGPIDDWANSRYVTVRYSVGMNESLRNSAKVWDKQSLHPCYYTDIIRPMLKKGAMTPFEIRTVDLHDSNPLKPYYMIDQVEASLICMVTATKNRVWYISVNYRDLPLEEAYDIDGTEEDQAKSQAIDFRRMLGISTAHRLAQAMLPLVELLED